MLNFGIKLPLFICTASAPFRWQCFCWFNSLRNIAHFLWMSLELGLPLDKLHTHKSLWEKPFFTLSWCLNKWGTMHLSFLEHLLFERLLNLCKGTFVWLNNTIRHHLFFFFYWGLNKKFYSHTLNFIFQPSSPSQPLHLLLTWKPFFNFRIVCHLKWLWIFKKAVDSWFLFVKQSYLFLFFHICKKKTRKHLQHSTWKYS